jgi:small conductance mechanosensitive channel
MVLEEFSVEIGPIPAAAGIVGWHLVLRSISYPRYYFWSFIILENHRIGDVVKFDNAGGTVEEISLRKTTLRDLDGTVHHIPHGEIKKVSNFLRISPINLDIGVGYGSNLEHVIGVINKVGSDLATDPPYGKITLFFLLNFTR